MVSNPLIKSCFCRLRINNTCFYVCGVNWVTKVVSETGNARMMTISECCNVDKLVLNCGHVGVYHHSHPQHLQHLHHEEDDDHGKEDGKIGLFVGVGRTGLGWGHHCGHKTTTILVIVVVVAIMIMMSTMINFTFKRNAFILRSVT